MHHLCSTNLDLLNHAYTCRPQLDSLYNHRDSLEFRSSLKQYIRIIKDTRTLLRIEFM